MTRATRGNVDLFRSLLKAIPTDQFNKTPRRSCEVLERLVARSVDRWTNSPVSSLDETRLQCVELLLDAGAHWNPPPEDIHYARRWIKEHDARYIAQLVRLLLYTPGAAELETVMDLCDSKALQTKMGTVDPPLIQELKELRKKSRRAIA